MFNIAQFIGKHITARQESMFLPDIDEKITAQIKEAMYKKNED